MRLASDARSDFIARACGQDTELAGMVSGIIRGEERTLETPAGGTTISAEALRAPSGVVPGAQIGPYTIIRMLGEGGFGEVWLGERRLPFVQRVAIKVIKPGMDSRGVLARFEQERRALSVLHHPHIATVIDGGVIDSTPGAIGRPYFVMEHVSGPPIHVYCRDKRLGMSDRLALLLPVCEAVQHAHTKGIIHRDLKPSNILVEEVDGRPIPKVIDFGIAKAVSEERDGRTVLTEHGLMIGTPEYMSPEQASGEVDIDTRTDVYSLGVVMYELLTGSPPFAPEDLRRKSLHEVMRIIREVDPPRPSVRLSVLGPAAELADARTAARELKRELEWIPLKAMRKDRERRYGSAESLARDIRRYMSGEALEAGPESRLYRARKFVVKHRAGVGAVLASMLALSVGLGVALWQRNEARLATMEAVAQRDVATSAIAFLRHAFSSVKPEMARGREVTLQEVLDRTASNNARIKAVSPAARAQIHSIIGDAYFAQSNLEKSREQFILASRAAREAHGTGHFEVLQGELAAALIDVVTGRDPAALQPLVSRAVEAEVPANEEARGYWQTLTSVASLVGSADLAGRVLDRAAFLMDAAGEPPRSLDRATLAFVRTFVFPDESEMPSLRATLEMAEEADPTNPTTLDMRGVVRMRMQVLGDPEASAFAEETIRRHRAINPGASLGLANELKELGAILRGRGETDKAVGILREAIARYHEIGATCEAAAILSAYDHLGGCHHVTERHEEALAVYSEAVEVHGACPSPDAYAGSFLWFNRGVAHAKLGDFRGALGDMEQSLVWAERIGDARRDQRVEAARREIEGLRAKIEAEGG